MKIVAVGEITIDHYVNLDRSFVGGISLNFAVHARRCGAASSLISCVGRDEGGRRVLARLAREGVNSTQVMVLDGQTATIDIEITQDGERHFPAGGYHRHVLANLQLSAASQAFILEHDVLALPCDGAIPGLTFQELMGSLAFPGNRVVDFGDASAYMPDMTPLIDALTYLDLAFISGNQDTIEALLPISSQFAGLIVVTLGAAGSAALVHGRVQSQPALAVPQVVDTTGCGDAFQAAFTVAYFSGADINQALQRGAQQAAAVLGHYGALG